MTDQISLPNQLSSAPYPRLQAFFAGLPVKTGKEGNREEILRVVNETLTHMWRICGKRLSISHYTVNLPGVPPVDANDVLSNALQSFKQMMRRKKVKCEYVWAREIGAQVTDGRPHYQLFCVCDGNRTRSASMPKSHLDRLLARRIGEERNYLHINPPQTENQHQRAMQVSAELDNFADAFNWMSYLAKNATKSAPACQKTFGYSRGFLGHSSRRGQNDAVVSVENYDLDPPAVLVPEIPDWLDLERDLDFDPLTGGSYSSKNKLLAALPCTEEPNPGPQASEMLAYKERPPETS